MQATRAWVSKKNRAIATRCSLTQPIEQSRQRVAPEYAIGPLIVELASAFKQNLTAIVQRRNVGKEAEKVCR